MKGFKHLAAVVGVLVGAQIGFPAAAQVDLDGSGKGSAQSYRLVVLTNDRDAANNELVLGTDDKGVVRTIDYVVHLNQKTTRKSFPVDLLAQSPGAVLEEEQGVKALTLTGTVNSEKGAGRLVWTFVSNGMTNTYKSCPVGIERDNRGQWYMFDFNTREVITQAKILSWSLGIETIQGICQN